MSMNVFGIIGAGTMGTDIAALAAESGFQVLLFDIDKTNLHASYELIKLKAAALLEKNRITDDAAARIVSNIHLADTLDEFEAADIVLECVPENRLIKKTVFAQLDRICKPGALLASNTGSLSITDLASATKRPESVIGLHFMTRVRDIELVEIICGLTTTRESFECAKLLVKRMGKKPVESQDYPGFIFNRILIPMINEAIFTLYEGAGTVEAIDKVMKRGINLPMGPLELADIMGLDNVLAITEELYRGFSDSKYRPCPLLKNYVTAGYLGKKTGRGFYTY